MDSARGGSKLYIATNVYQSFKKSLDEGDTCSAGVKALVAIPTAPLWGVVGGLIEVSARAGKGDLCDRQAEIASTDFNRRASDVTALDHSRTEVTIHPDTKSAPTRGTTQAQAARTWPAEHHGKVDLDYLLARNPGDPLYDAFAAKVEAAHTGENLKFLRDLRAAGDNPSIEKLAELQTLHVGFDGDTGLNVSAAQKRLLALALAAVPQDQPLAMAAMKSVKSEAREMLTDNCLRAFLLANPSLRKTS